MQGSNKTIRYAWLAYVFSYPAAYGLAKLATLEPEPSGRSMSIALCFLGGMALTAIISVILTISYTRDVDRSLYARMILSSIPWIILIWYVFIMLFTGLGDQIAPS